MSNMKKIITGLAAAAIGVTGAIGASALTWKVTGYDTSVIEQVGYDSYRVGVVYEQYDDNGMATGVVASGDMCELYGLDEYAKATFSAPSFERAWPNREYVAVVANGVDTGKVVYTGVKENLNYRKANYMWELAAPHRIYNRTQALINGEWYTDASYPVEYAGDVAKVKSGYNKYYGFGYWKDNGSSLSYMPAELRNYASNVDTSIWYDGGVKVNALAPGAVTDMTGLKDIKIKQTFNYTAAGPRFNFDGSVSAGNEFAYLVDSASASADVLAAFGINELVKNVYSYDGSCAYMKTEWVDASFEKAAPYRYYQILKVGNVLLDGTGNLPYVYRYVVSPDGVYATANVTAMYSTSVTLNKATPAKWNDSVKRFEFLVDIVTTETLYHNGVVISNDTVKSLIAQPSGVFGQIEYSEAWNNGKKVISGVISGKALTDGSVYTARFTGNVNDTIDWGNVSFTAVNATLDDKVVNYNQVIVPAVVD